ncbi:Ca2+-dependent phosphoinositide-specific phospholipase C [Echinicola sp. 20G]|uniref:Ca2+-dependent phosphoinositide-specific phospholipase C n=1 Tax=Echinicola sp. 20G TaxID=2781961 RepID=UPI00190FF2C7|nr:Ca2+-dependent phosphoinositide-specific phospholipase C [Echinicola sp. 20G]
MKYTNSIKASILGLCLAFQGCGQKEIAIEGGRVKIPADLKINEIQVLGTHNSYATKRDTAILNFIDPIFTGMMGQYFNTMSEEAKAKYKEYHPNQMTIKEMLAYDFPDFPTQLDAGMRSLAIDIVYDPSGNRFSRPAIYDIMKAKGIHHYQPYDSTGMDQPGFKVMHIADIDFLSHYKTFEQALNALKSWSDKNPTHAPVYIMIEAKDAGLPIFPNSTEVLPFTAEVYDQLDHKLESVLGREKIITPDDVRGDYATLEEAVLAQNWPTLEASQGKFIFLLLPGSAGLSNDHSYLQDHPSLKGRMMFVKADVGQDHCGFLLLDNAIVRKGDIEEAVKKGYMVRTRSDIETYEAKVNDMSRAETAFESGAQVVSTDFFEPGNAYGTDYVVRMPNNQPLRLNPVNRAEGK